MGENRDLGGNGESVLIKEIPNSEDEIGQFAYARRRRKKKQLSRDEVILNKGRKPRSIVLDDQNGGNMMGRGGARNVLLQPEKWGNALTLLGSIPRATEVPIDLGKVERQIRFSQRKKGGGCHDVHGNGYTLNRCPNPKKGGRLRQTISGYSQTYKKMPSRPLENDNCRKNGS